MVDHKKRSDRIHKLVSVTFFFSSFPKRNCDGIMETNQIQKQSEEEKHFRLKTAEMCLSLFSGVCLPSRKTPNIPELVPVLLNMAHLSAVMYEHVPVFEYSGCV